MEQSNFGNIKIEEIEKLLDAIKRHNPNEDKEINITFEFLVGSLFPSLYKNFQDKIMQEHTTGFSEGYKEGHSDGEDEGYNEGYDAGYDYGYDTAVREIQEKLADILYTL